MTARKVKVSVTLSRDVLALVDQEAAGATNRSAVVEAWLRRAARQRVIDAIEQATEDYYATLSREERAEGEALARSLSRAARKVRFDDVPLRSLRSPRRQR